MNARHAFILSSLAITSCGSGGVGASATAVPPAIVTHADATHPAVVELYQSQGCSSCPAADANVNAIAGRPDILALSFAVTYWDNLGWKDTFARPGFTARQWDYARSAGRDQVATPQVIVNGRGTVVGNDAARLAMAIRDNARHPGGPTIAVRDGKVVISAAATTRPLTIWLVRYDPRTLRVPIRAGENDGKTLLHRNIVRSLDAFGTWSGESMALAIPAAANPAYRTAVLLQQGKGGPIMAASRI